jgi:hypothetical protein
MSVLDLSDADVLREITVSSSRPTGKGTMSTTVGFVVRSVTSDQDTRSLCCPDCKLQFNLIQPDENEPTRLLGTCDGCSKWVYLLEREPDWKSSFMIELPTGKWLQQELTKVKASEQGRPGNGP